MDTKRHDPDTRRHPKGEGFDTIPPGGLESLAGRRWLLPAAGMGVGLLFTLCMAFVYRMGMKQATRDAAVAAASASPSVAARRVLLLDPVCRKPVDPSTAPAVLDFGGKSIYFDSLDCLNTFRSDPVKYGAGRIRVHIEPRPDENPSPAGRATPGGATLDDPTRGPGAPPPGDSAPNGGAGTLDEGPLNESPSQPDEGPQPSPRAVNDAPPVTESYPDASASAVPVKAPRPAGKVPPAAAPDDNGFSLPPDLKEGPPPRRPGGKPAPAATEGPPSVEENPPSQ